MLFELLILFAWPFWLLLFAFLVWETFLIEEERAGSATASLLGFLALLTLFSDWHPLILIKDHFEAIIAFIVIYLVLGVLYVFPRWMVYVKDEAKRFEPTYKRLKSKWPSTDTSKVYKDFNEMLRSEYRMPPMPWDYGVKGKIYLWMGYWPLSGIWLLIHYPVEWFYDWAYATIKAKLEFLSYKIFQSHFE